MYLLSRSPGMTSLIVDEGATHRKLAKRWKAVIAMATTTLHASHHIGIMYVLSRSPGMTTRIVDAGAIQRKLAKRWKAVIAMAMTMRIRFTAERCRGVSSVGSLSIWAPDTPRRI